MDRLKHYFEEKDLSGHQLSPSANQNEKDQAELYKHFTSFEKGQQHAYKGKVLASMGAYRFFSKMTEIRKRPREQQISIKECAEEYSKYFGRYHRVGGIGLSTIDC